MNANNYGIEQTQELLYLFLLRKESYSRVSFHISKKTVGINEVLVVYEASLLVPVLTYLTRLARKWCWR